MSGPRASWWLWLSLAVAGCAGTSGRDAGAGGGTAAAGGQATGGGATGGGGGHNAGCTPRACVANVSCGEVDDGCGSLLSCGACAGGLVCGGGGVANTCGDCTPPTRKMNLPRASLATPFSAQLFDYVQGYLSSYTLAGELPPGLMLEQSGALYGTPRLPGSFAFEVEVVDGCPTTHTARLPFSMEVDIPGPRARSVANGFFFGLAATELGSVLSWGLNTNGELGRGTLGEAGTFPDPEPVLRAAGPPVAGAIAVAAAERSGFALLATGRVLAWGHNEAGELADGTDAGRARASEVLTAPGQPLDGIVALAPSANSHLVALTDAGTLFAWGANDDGQLSTAASGTQRFARPVIFADGGLVGGVVRVVVNRVATAALLDTGHVLQWGRVLGQTRARPSLVTWADGGVVGGVVGLAGGASHFLALTSMGEVIAWGDNASGELGDGRRLEFDVPPTTVLERPGVALASVTAIAASQATSFAVVDGGVLSWGANGHAQLGDPTAPAGGRLFPGAVRTMLGPPLAGIDTLTANFSTAFGVFDGGAVVGWGDNGTAQRAQSQSASLPAADYVLLGH